MARMLGESLAAARARGDAISVLIAAEWPIYGRFGYAPATLSADYILHRSRPGANCSGDPTRVRQVEREEFGDVAPAVYSAARRQQAGQIDRDRVGGTGFSDGTATRRRRSCPTTGLSTRETTVRTACSAGRQPADSA
jgi:predicted acetyltransferase